MRFVVIFPFQKLTVFPKQSALSGGEVPCPDINQSPPTRRRSNLASPTARTNFSTASIFPFVYFLDDCLLYKSVIVRTTEQQNIFTKIYVRPYTPHYILSHRRFKCITEIIFQHLVFAVHQMINDDFLSTN